MLTLNFSPFPQIITNKLCLRKISLEDVNEVLFFRSDEEVMKYLDRPKAKDKDEATKWIEKILEAEQKNESVNWAISLKDTTKMIGNICFWSIVKEHYRAEIGYTLHPQHQGKGIMQEALEAVLDYGFSTMQLHSVEAKINPHNTASKKLLERNHFEREAYFKEDYYFDGKFLDTAVYSLLASSFRKNILKQTL